MSSEGAELLRRAWRSIEGDDPLSRLQRTSLEMSVKGDPELEAVLVDLKTPIQAELDLRLSGAGVEGHKTAARPFGRFVSHTADAVKEITKEMLGRRRLRAGLLIEALSPSSVRVVFRAPDAPRPQEVTGEVQTAESVAVELFAAVLEQTSASVAEPGRDISTTLLGLKAPARVAVRRIADDVIKGGWDVEGQFRRRGQPAHELHLTQAVAHALRAAAMVSTAETTTVTLTGTVDGQRESLGAMWFVPDVGPSFEAAVTSPDLLRSVAEHAAGEFRVRAVFQVVTTYPMGDAQHPSRSFALESIEAIPSDVQTEIDPLGGPGRSGA